MSFLKYQLVLVLFFLGCKSLPNQEFQTIDYRAEMRNFVIGISNYAKERNSNFAIIPQNGIELVTTSGKANGVPSVEYLNAIDGHGQEDLFFGYDKDDKATPNNTTDYLTSLLQVSQRAGNSIIVIDYVKNQKKIKNSYKKNSKLDFVPFVATERNLNNIPDLVPHEKNTNDIEHLADIKNFLFFINPENYNYKDDYLDDIAATDYDMVIIDLFFNGNQFTKEEIDRLKIKKNGSKRIVCCYMSIGEAEDYRYYWEKDWDKNQPNWLDKENKNWKGNYKVKYWNKGWQQLVFGTKNSYLDKILAVGFDGVYLDIIDAFEHFENQ